MKVRELVFVEPVWPEPEPEPEPELELELALGLGLGLGLGPGVGVGPGFGLALGAAPAPAAGSRLNASGSPALQPDIPAMAIPIVDCKNLRRSSDMGSCSGSGLATTSMETASVRGAMHRDR